MTIDEMIAETDYGGYLVSSTGKVYSTNYNNTSTTKELKPSSVGRYLTVGLSVNGKRYRKTIHRLVAKAFIPNPHNLPCVNHKDGNKANNNLSNLEWCTHKQNTAHAISIGLSPKSYPRTELVKSKCKQTGLANRKASMNVVHLIKQALSASSKDWGYMSKIARQLQVDRRLVRYVNNGGYQ